MSTETQELIRICEALPEAKRVEVADFARFLLDRGRPEDARPVVTQVGEIVGGSGAVLLERQVDELRSRLDAAGSGQAETDT